MKAGDQLRSKEAPTQPSSSLPSPSRTASKQLSWPSSTKAAAWVLDSQEARARPEGNGSDWRQFPAPEGTGPRPWFLGLRKRN